MLSNLFLPARFCSILSIWLNELFALRHERLEQALAVGAAEACARIPTRAGLVVAVVALRDVTKRGVGWCGVEQGIDKATRFV